MVRNVLLRGTSEHRKNGRENVGNAKVGGPPGRGLCRVGGSRGGGGGRGIGGYGRQREVSHWVFNKLKGEFGFYS